MRIRLTSLITILALLVTGGCAGSASVAVNPTNGAVLRTREKTLYSCDPGASSCRSGSGLAFKPVDAVFGPAGGVIFLTRDSLVRCDTSGGSCQLTSIGISNAHGIDVAESGQIVIVGDKGEVIVCNASGCSPR